MQRIIGLTGSLASGCTTVANHLHQKGLKSISVSREVLAPLAKKHGAPFSTRYEKQKFGNQARRELRLEYRNALTESIRTTGEAVVIECLRNPIEIDFLREEFPNFYLLALYAPKVERKSRYKGDDFDECDQRDEGEADKLGQQVRKCVNVADIVLNNSHHWGHSGHSTAFLTRLDSFVRLLDSPHRAPTDEELIMHLAYSVSLQSNCIQRQVGAVIVDSRFRIQSLGFNDVPAQSESCFDLTSNCYRKTKQQELVRDVCWEFKFCPFCGSNPDFKADLFDNTGRTPGKSDFLCGSCHRDISNLFRGRNLDYCRSLHAEENAILANPFLSARTSKSDAIYIFATTFPCMLCAKRDCTFGYLKSLLCGTVPGV